MEGAVRPFRRVPPGARHAPGQGQRPVRLRRQRIPVWRTLLPPHQGPALATQRLHGRQDAAQTGQGTWRQGQGVQAGLAVRARRATGGAAVRRLRQGPLSAEHDHVSLRPRIEHVQALGHGRGQAVRCGRRRARRAEERRRDVGQLHAHRRPEASAGSRPDRKRQGLGLHERAAHRRDVEEGEHDQADPLL